MKKIAVIPNNKKDINYEYTKRLCGFLNGKAEIVMHSECKTEGVNAVYKDDVYENADAVIILGGDGTMLQAAEPCGMRGIPVMGINLGKVGFMTEVETADMENACRRLLADDYDVEERMMMEVEVCEKDKAPMCHIALNDAVVSKTDATMISMELYSSDEKISEYMADGLIISTPTGSTGYSLSAGGPVADPEMDLFIATPICAHTLSARPMLVSEKKMMELKLMKYGGDAATVTIDGEDKHTIKTGDKILIRKSPYRMKIIKLGKKSFYYTMMEKL